MKRFLLISVLSAIAAFVGCDSAPARTEAVAVKSAVEPKASERLPFVDDLDAIPIVELGPRLEHDRFFPERVNVGVAQIVGENRLRLRVWERGVGETNSSGTGSSAAAVASILNGHTESPVDVITPAGTLPVRWEADGVYLSGPAEIVFHGEYLT